MGLGFAFGSRRICLQLFKYGIQWFHSVPTRATNLLVPPNNEPLKSLSEFQSAFSGTFDDVRYSHTLAVTSQVSCNAKRYRSPSYQVGDEIWLSRKYVTTDIRSQNHHESSEFFCYGPFKIIERIRQNAFRLEFPSNIKVHNTVHVKHNSYGFKQPADIASPPALK